MLQEVAEEINGIKNFFSDGGEYYFKVDKEFPKILYKDLHNAISKVAYKLDTNLLLSFDIGKNKSEEIFLDEKI